MFFNRRWRALHRSGANRLMRLLRSLGLWPIFGRFRGNKLLSMMAQNVLAGFFLRRRGDVCGVGPHIRDQTHGSTIAKINALI